MHPDDELASLRRLLDALERGSMKLLRNEKDVTQEGSSQAKAGHIEYLESVLARTAAGRAMPKGPRGAIRAKLDKLHPRYCKETQLGV